MTTLGADIVASEPPDSTKDEWTECRATIGRMDSVLADIRKYGFSLMTLLLTASALITTANPVADRVAASSAVTILVLVLFLMDRYWWVLFREAVERATELETRPRHGGEQAVEPDRPAQPQRLRRHRGLRHLHPALVWNRPGDGGAQPDAGWALWSLIIVTGTAVGMLLTLHVCFDLLLPLGFQTSRLARRLREWRDRHPHKGTVS